MKGKKDHMSNALDDFWTSGSIPQHKLNTPKIKSSEDDTWDAFWGRGNFAPAPRIPNASQGSQYVKNVQPVQYRQQVHYQVPQKIQPMTAADRASVLREELKLAQIRAKQGLRNSQNTSQVIGGVIRAGRYGATVAVPAAVRAGRYGVKVGIPAAQGAAIYGINTAKGGINFTRRAVSSVANRGAYNTARGTSAGRTAAGVADWIKNKLPKSKPAPMSKADVSSYADQLME